MCPTPSTSCSSTSAAPTCPQAGQRKLDRVYARQEYRRAFPGEIGDLRFPSSVFDSYTGSLLRAVDTTGIAEAGLKVVVDAVQRQRRAGPAQPARPARRGRADDQPRPRRVPAHRDRRRPPVRAWSGSGEIVASARAAFGVRFDPVGERLSLVDERGRIIEDDRALLVMLDLVAAERRSGRVALPVTTTRIAEQVAAYHGTQVEWTTTVARRPDPGGPVRRPPSSAATGAAASSSPSSAASSTARRPSCG